MESPTSQLDSSSREHSNCTEPSANHELSTNQEASNSNDRLNSQDSSISSDTTENLSEHSITLRKYYSEWQQLSLGVEEVRRRALTGALRVSRMRSVAWAILLEVLPPESEKWLDVLRSNREKYEILKTKYACNPRQPPYSTDNPLSQNNESIWNQYFLNRELQSTITLDVVRTFPGVEIFKLCKIQTTMINVLFIFAKETPSLVYRQGMHEILAPLLFIIHSDHLAAEHIALGEEFTEMLNPAFIEHDSYAIFEVMMRGIEKFYSVHEKSTLLMKPQTSRGKNDVMERVIEKESEVVRYLRLTKEQTLSVEDTDLIDHFEKCDISLSLFGIRWLRVLFGREFSLQDLLVLWDAILAEGKDFSLTSYILVAMLHAIKKPLLLMDSMECLTILLNYPTSVDVHYVIEYALYTRHPDQYCKPAPRFFSCVPSNKKRTTHARKISAKKASIVNKSNLDVNKIKIATRAEDSIVDGVVLQDSTYLREEVNHAHNIMSLCGLKLEQYEAVLSKTVSKSLPASHPANQALVGLKELRALLKTRYRGQVDVEPALEANESAHVQSKNKRESVNQSSRKESRDTNPKEKFLSKLPAAKEVPLRPINVEKSESTDNLGMPCVSPFGTECD